MLFIYLFFLYYKIFGEAKVIYETLLPQTKSIDIIIYTIFLGGWMIQYLTNQYNNISIVYLKYFVIFVLIIVVCGKLELTYFQIYIYRESFI